MARSKRLDGKGRDDADTSPLFVTSFEKGIAVLKAFTRETPRLTLAQITKLTGMDKSAVQRFLFTLHSLGYLKKDEVTKQYTLSPTVLEFAYAYLYSDPLIERTQPLLAEAHVRTGETVNLAVLEGNDIILVSRIPSRNVLSMNIQIGIRLPAIHSASGLAIAAWLPEGEREQLIAGSVYRSYTSETILDPNRIRSLVSLARDNGYAMLENQVIYTDISVAAPVIDSSGAVVAAVSISVPSTRMSSAQAREVFVPVAIETARKASIALGAY